MDIERLKYFTSAANCLNFSEVARCNFVSQPTVSHQISLLEQELGINLFTRQGKRLHLSKDGEFFLPIANRILDEIYNAKIEITRYKQGECGSISVCVAETCRADYLRCITEFSKRYPEILTNTDVMLSGIHADYIINSNYDICFVAEKTIRGSELFDSIVTSQDRLCLVLPKDFPAPDDLRDLSFLDGLYYIGLNTYSSPMLHEHLQVIFKTKNYVPHYIHKYNHMEDALMSVAMGIGYSILPYSIAQYYRQERIKCILFEEEEFQVNCAAAWLKNRENRSVDYFIKVIEDVFGK